jgi:ATP-dependent Clp protease ATP-binding subunit ClpA
MFERYTEAARRALFFARYEVSVAGGLAIETEHLLLGLLRDGKGLTQTLCNRAHLSYETVREEIHKRTGSREKVSTSVEIPFSTQVQRVLNWAREEADLLHHAHIGTEHLMLGLLRDEHSVATSILTDHGLTLEGMRAAIVEVLAKGGDELVVGVEVHPTFEPEIGPRHQIEVIKRRVKQLGRGADEQVRELVARIQRDLDELMRRLE